MLDDTKGGIIMSLWSSLTKGIKNTVKGVTQVFSGKNPFGSGGGFNSLLSGAAGDIQDFAEGYTGERMARKNLEAQEKQWSLQNDLNERQFAYQQKLNQQQMEREDNAMVRKVNDLKNAGLNPVLAANGSGAPSAPLSAPALKAPAAPHLDDYSAGVRGAVDQVLSLIGMKKSFAVQDAQISKMMAEKDYFDILKDKVGAETTGIEIDNQTKSEMNEARLQSINLDNQLKSGTLQNDILMSYKKLQQVDVDIENSKLDGMLRKLQISHEDVMIEQDRLKNKLYVQDYEKGELELTAKTIAIYKAVAEYNSFMFDVDFYNRHHKLPVGYQLPMLARYSDYGSGLIQSAWQELKEFANGRFDFKRFSTSLSDLVSRTSENLSEVSKFFGVSKNNLIYSFRRGDDGVRRNRGMFYVGGRH